MNKTGLLFFLIIFIFTNGYSQGNKSYDLEFSNFKISKRYKINYHKTAKKTILVVNKETSSRKFGKKDSLKIVGLLKSSTPESKKEIAKIIEDHTQYKSDTLVIKPGELIEIKVEKFVIDWSNIKRDLEMNPDQRIILDGYMVKLSLDSNNRNYEEIYAQTPTEKSHPRIFKLISDIESYYKKEAKNPVIN